MAKKILGLVGEIASGKGTAAKYVAEKYGSSTHRFSTMLRDVAKRMYLEESRENLQTLSTAFRHYFGDDALAKAIYHDVVSDAQDLIVVDGVRRLPDVQYLHTLPEFKLVYIETSLEKRYKRIIERGENVDDAGKTFDDFKKDQKREAEKDVKALKAGADFVVNNDGAFEDLYRQLDDIIGEK